jgi:hypothetical protein
MAAHHLVLVVLEKALRSRISSSGQLTGPGSCSAEGAVSITMGFGTTVQADCAVLCWLRHRKGVPSVMLKQLGKACCLRTECCLAAMD